MRVPCWYREADRTTILRRTTEARRFGYEYQCPAETNLEQGTEEDPQDQEITVEYTTEAA